MSEIFSTAYDGKTLEKFAHILATEIKENFRLHKLSSRSTNQDTPRNWVLKKFASKLNAEEAYLGLGANLGNPKKTFENALSKISDFASIEKVSKLYKSTPYGFSDQPSLLMLRSK